jgi:pimeloyl-ACP methyl ester carboxylesterase
MEKTTTQGSQGTTTDEDADGEVTVLLVAGLWLDGRAWDPVLPALAERGVRAVPLTLPGQGDGDPSATYEDQVGAVVGAVDAAAGEGTGRVVVVGHSAAATLAWVAADRRPDRVAGVVLIGGVPASDGRTYADFFEPAGDVVPFPGWDAFDEADVADLDDAARRGLEQGMAPVPLAVTRGTVALRDPRRRETRVVLVCPEFSPEQGREWIASGDVPELQDAPGLTLVDLDSGHWPMASRPVELAGCLAEAARSMVAR